METEVVADIIETVELASEQTGGPILAVGAGLVMEVVYTLDKRRFKRVVCRVSDVERGFGYKHRGGSTAREQASLVLLGLCAGLRCLKRRTT